MSSGDAATSGGGSAGGSSTGGGGAGGSNGGGSAAGAAGGPDVTFGVGPQCRADGRQLGFSFYMPPCVQWNSTNNGGATADGVTDKQIKVIRWLGFQDDATKAILRAYKLSDEDSVIKRSYDAYRAYSNHHYETYGREVVYEDYAASAVSTNDEAMIADAAQIADKHPFAVIVGNPAAVMPTVLATELNARGVLCSGCTVSLSTGYYNENPDIIAGGLPSINEYCQQSAEYIGKRLAGKNAIHAGDELNPLQGFKTKTRVFGLMYLNGQMGKVDPEGERGRKICEDAFAKYGVSFAVQVAYLYDPGRNQNDVSNMIAQFKGQGCHHDRADRRPAVAHPHHPGGHPAELLPRVVRHRHRALRHDHGRAALRPEPVAPRLRHHAAVGHVERRQDVHGREGVPRRPTAEPPTATRACCATSTEGWRSSCSPASRWRGRISPKTRSRPACSPIPRHRPVAVPRGCRTSTTRRILPTAIKDFAEVYYDITAQGPDERGQQGTGMMMKTDNGQRYQVGQWPSDDPHVYQDPSHHPLAVSDNPPGGGDYPYQPGPAYPLSGCMDCTG